MKALDGVLLLSSISLGFYGACLSVFASIFNTKVVLEIMRDQNYRKEFIAISTLALCLGFFTVFFTIIFQVMVANGDVVDWILNVTNAFWGLLLINFFGLQMIFINVAFLIFFSNSDDKSDNVYTPTIKDEYK